MTLQGVAVAAYAGLLVAGAGLGLWAARRARSVPARWPARVRRLAGRPFAGVDAVGLPMAVMAMILVADLVSSAAGIRDEAPTPRAVIVQSVAVHWTILALLVLRLRRAGWGWRRGFGVRADRWGRDAALGAAAYLAMLPVVVACAVAYRGLLHLLGMDTGMQDVARVITGAASPGARAYLLFLGIGLGPLAEECLFRGVLLPVLVRRLGLAGGALAVSAVFAAIHAHLPSLLPLFVLSVWLCLGYAYAGSIVVPVVMHVLFNAVNLGLAFVVEIP